MTSLPPPAPGSVPVDRSAEWLAARISAALASAEAELSRECQGRSLCTIGRDAPGGGPLSVKAAEGRMAALLEARRELRRRLRAGEPTDAEHLLGEIRRRWQVDLDRRRRQQASQAWIAYLEAGIAALDLVPLRAAA